MQLKDTLFALNLSAFNEVYIININIQEMKGTITVCVTQNKIVNLQMENFLEFDQFKQLT